jgi:ribulose-phosphate 3-epimerase
VQAYVSLWSADLLALGAAVDLVAGVADGLHVDVFDGHSADELLFGPDLVAALRRRTAALIDVHLMVTDPDHWAERFMDVGADMVTVQHAAPPNIAATSRRIRERGVRPSLGLEVHEPVEAAVTLFDEVDRVLVMGTAIGVKSVGQGPATPDRVAALVAARAGGTTPAVFVDGGIRSHTVEALAAAGADGVIPGSLVFGTPDPVAAIHALHALPGPDATGRQR